MHRYLYLVLLLAGVGCARGPEHLRREVEEKSSRIEELERRLRELQAESVQSQEELRRELVWTRDKLRHDAEAHSREIRAKDRQIGTLEAELAGMRRRLEERESKADESADEPDADESLVLPPLAASPPSTLGVQLVQAPEAPPVDLFPLKVYDVAGRSLPSGTHTVMRKVESAEVYKDALGVVRSHYTWEQGVVTQYTTSVSFSLENPTPAALRASVRAGATSRDIVLAPGEAQTGIHLPAARGSRLLVVVGGRSRSIEVEYAD